MDVYKINKQQRTKPCFDDFKENHLPYHDNVDYEALEDYNKDNKHFSVVEILFNKCEQTKEVTGYSCIYRYENYDVKLEYNLLHGIWHISSNDLSMQQYKRLSLLLEDLNYNRKFSFKKQIELIILRFDCYFSALFQTELKQKNDSKEEMEIRNVFVQPYEPSLVENKCIPQANSDHHDVQNDTSYQSVTNSLTSSSAHSDHIHSHNSCSSLTSIKNAEFIPSFTTYIPRRLVIESILLHVQQKKKLFKSVMNTFKLERITTTIYELGLEFLRIHDGRFNYPLGHTFVMSFGKRTWFLTIEKIKCIECKLGEPEPRSLLILQYKNQFITAQV